MFNIMQMSDENVSRGEGGDICHKHFEVYRQCLSFTYVTYYYIELNS